MRRPVTVRKANIIQLRDYDVNKAIANNEKFEVSFENELMTLTPEELVSKRTDVQGPINSKFNSSSYNLFSYRWKSDEMDY